MNWTRDKKSGIYTSDNKRWKISNIDKKGWVLRDTKTGEKYPGSTLKFLQAKVLELEKLELAKEEKVVTNVEIHDESEVVDTTTVETTSSEVKKSFVGMKVNAKPKNHLSNGLENFVPVEGRVLR